MNRQKVRALPYLALLLPVDLSVLVVFLLIELIGLPLRILRRPQPHFPVLKNRSASIQVLNWNGKPLLEACLPRVLDAVRHEGGDHEVLVVDNGSTDGSAQFVQERYPDIRVVQLDRNYRYTGGNNRGVRAARNEIVVFLNNDMIVDRNFLRPLLEAFSDTAVFAATSRIQLEHEGRQHVETGKTRARCVRGFIEMWHDPITAADRGRSRIPVFWAGGGSCAFDRSKYIHLGGMDPLYDPFYVEDTDLSYQAWKRGWKCLLVPASQVVHKHRATNEPRFGLAFIENTICRNQYLFVWKNLTDPSMFFRHLISLPRIHGRSMLARGAWFEMRAFFRALRLIPRAAWRRLAGLGSYTVSDQEVFRRFTEP